MLEEVLDFYDCADLLPFAQRVIWLSSIKEALGYVPRYIPIDYEELQALVILNEEQNKKISYENFRLRRESKRNAASLDNMLER